MYFRSQLPLWATLCFVSIVLCASATTSTAWGQHDLLAVSPATQSSLLPQQAPPVPENPYWRWSLLQSNDTGNWEIYLYRYNDVNFPQLLQLTNNLAADVDAQFNYGADKIVFVSDRDTTIPGLPNTELYLMDTDGSNQQRLTNNPARDEMPDWSLANNKIVYSSGHEDGMEIYLINPDGTGRQRLTNLAGNDWFPTWSPDGAQIVWMRQGVNTGQLWIMNADGSNQRPLTDHLGYLGRPIWSPDGRYIAFEYISRTEESTNLGLVNADGTNLHEIRCTSPDQYEARITAAWAPDSSALFFTRYKYDKNNTLLETVINSTQIINGNCEGGTLDLFFDLRVKMLTDIGRADPWPPQSALLPVPPYTRLPNLILQLNGEDVGRSGLLSYDVHYQMADNATWKKGEEYASSIVVLQPPAAGPIAVRSRARDVALNEEAWPAGANEATTFLYRALFQGRYTDQRGIPLANQPIEIGPTSLEQGVSSADGTFLVHVDGLRYVVNNTMRLSTESDWTRDLYAIPADNLIKNGTFEETSLSSWSAAGEPLPQISEEIAYNGRKSLRLGNACIGICTPPGIPEFITECIPNAMPGCVDPKASFPPNYIISSAQLFVDQQDNLHFIGGRDFSDAVYQHGQPNAPWDAPITLGTMMPIGAIRGLTQDNGDLHLVWSSQDGILFYRKRTTDGTWHATQQIGSGTNPSIALDSHGLIHLLYTDVEPHQSEKQSLHYRKQQTNGSWSAPIDIALYPYNYLSLPAISHAIAVTADDRVHLVWGKPEGQTSAKAFRLVYKVREANGRWGDEITLETSATNVDRLHLLATQNLLQLLWQQDGSGFYTSRADGQEWAAAEQIGLFELATIDGSGTIYLVQESTAGRTFTSRFKAPGKPWSDQFQLEPPQFQAEPVAIQGGHEHLIHTLWGLLGSPFYYSPAPLTQTVMSQIQQSITIPSTLHRPTLSFLYALDRSGSDSSEFTVQVGNGVTETQVFSTTAMTPWKHSWIGLEAWQGKTITITFAVQQKAGDLPIRVHLDEITLTSWQTAVPQGFAPRQVAPGVGATLVITGENFIGTPIVQVGEQLLANVQANTEEEISVPLPMNLVPGSYPLWIQNPGETPRSYVGQLQVGAPLYLPLVAKQ